MHKKDVHIARGETDRMPGIYVHVPFCRSKCPYCGFYSIASTSLVPRWLTAFERETDLTRDRCGLSDSLYFGGGTPSLLDTKDLSIMTDLLFSRFNITRDAEITMEANPGDLTKEKAETVKSLGFNRISLGVQSFEDRELSFLGRRHTAGQAEKAIKRLRAVGFTNISLDLIYGFEGQTLNGWMETLKRAVAFTPEHLSCYQLSIEKRTPFERLYKKGLLAQPGEEEQGAFFLATTEFLKTHGYVHYEISSFARDMSLVSRHNTKYWRHVPYLGLGPSAHSFQGATRRWNVRSVKKYCEMLEHGKAPVEGHEDLTEEQLRLEEVSLGLRTRQGLDLGKITGGFASKEMLSRLQEAGFLRIIEDRIIPTRKGFLVADALPLYLLSFAEHS